MKHNKLSVNNSEFVIFKTEDERISVNVLFENDTVWLTQEQMAALFDKGRSTITEHISNVFKEGELDEKWYVGISDTPLNTGLLKAKHRKKELSITILM
ncbi:MAG: hypothetical protein PHQ11_03410 [Paludibacter sp.]|nr:hypothetical protein [Paludibacter sp.]MDD4199739.1 hypothetical protein [Paludibacter sp.]MDD4429321.1 hypothetical protein [Paludibacter sp.]